MKESPSPSCISKVSVCFLISVVVAFVATLLLVISFSSPYWLESYKESYSDFVRLGLWDVCFKNYRHPSYLFDEKFDGCQWIFSYKYQNIRDWLQPGWMIFVQALMSVGIIFSILSVSLIFVLLMQFCVAFRIFMLAVIFVFEALTALSVFLAVSVFRGMCFDRSWIQYPNFNHLSWGFGLAVVSFVFHGCVADYTKSKKLQVIPGFEMKICNFPGDNPKRTAENSTSFVCSTCGVIYLLNSFPKQLRISETA